MKLRQAFKICDRVTTRNLISKQVDEAIIITGIKNVPYTFGQFLKAVRRVDKTFKRQYKRQYK